MYGKAVEMRPMERRRSLLIGGTTLREEEWGGFGFNF